MRKLILTAAWAVALIAGAIFAWMAEPVSSAGSAATVSASTPTGSCPAAKHPPAPLLPATGQAPLQVTTATATPTGTATTTPTATPTATATVTATATPTATATATATATPTATATATATATPTATATVTATATPTATATVTPGATATATPTATPLATATPTPTVTPSDQIQQLVDCVQSLGLEQGIANSLIAKLNAAIDSLSRGDTVAACNQLAAFQNEAQAQSGKALTPSQAAELIAAAAAISAQLGCT